MPPKEQATAPPVAAGEPVSNAEASKDGTPIVKAFPVNVPPVAPIEYNKGDKVLYTDSDGVVYEATIVGVNDKHADGSQEYSITFDDSARGRGRDAIFTSRLRPPDDTGATSNRIEMDLPKTAGVPAGTYRYSTSKRVHDSHLWEMYYVNTVYDDIVIVLLVDHNPMCPAKRTWPLTVSRCYLRR